MEMRERQRPRMIIYCLFTVCHVLTMLTNTTRKTSSFHCSTVSIKIGSRDFLSLTDAYISLQTTSKMNFLARALNVLIFNFMD
jgi:hypothetical protein